MVARIKMKNILILLSISPAFGVLVCRDGEWRCDGKKCIPHKWMCDGDPDCTDGTDEMASNCQSTPASPSCRASQYQCANGNCIPSTWRCDGQDDCRDNSDEQDCLTTCRDSEFRCASDGQCIAKRWKCDGQRDCQDGSDEDGCSSETTPLPPHMFQCGSGARIPSRWVCDGDQDCSEGEDEKDCSSVVTNQSPKPASHCRDNEFQCGSYCIMQTWVCDGGVDCPNGEDEADCEQVCPAETHFSCTNKQCVLGHLRCNGENDCADGSDEADCAQQPAKVNETKVECNLTSHFLCNQTKCISRRDLCDGKNDCGDWQDESEEVCGVNECERNNGGCTQDCVDERDGYHCACQNGYRLVGRYTCEDIDECEEIPGICSQQCTNTQGGFHCSCLPGYERVPGNYTRCKAASGEPYLIFSHRYDIRSLRLRDNDMTSLVSAREATALDYLFTGHQIIWSDNKENQIIRANITSPEEQEVLVNGEEVSADGLAVDWIHSHIYYTDTTNFKIRLVSWDARWVKTVVQEQLGQPRAIAVNPHDGYIFWTDWGSSPKIERAGLDGEGRVAIVTSPHVYWPNGITIDLPNSHIYWCDGKLNTISRARFDGSQVEVILYSPSVVRLPYSITVFEDRLYWTDWSQRALYSADKFTGEDLRNVSAGHLLESPKVVHVFHEYRQPAGENVCADHPCSHLCLKGAQGLAKCVCPDGLLLSTTDSLTCVEFDLPDNPMAEDLPDNSLVPEEEGDVADALDDRTVPIWEGRTGQGQQGATPGPHLGMIVGVASGATVLLALVILAGWWKLQSRRDIPHIRFPNPIYRKTTDEEGGCGGFEEGGGGFIIGQEHMLFKGRVLEEDQAEEGIDTPDGDADDLPLAPKK